MHLSVITGSFFSLLFSIRFWTDFTFQSNQSHLNTQFYLFIIKPRGLTTVQLCVLFIWLNIIFIEAKQEKYHICHSDRRNVNLNTSRALLCQETSLLYHYIILCCVCISAYVLMQFEEYRICGNTLFRWSLFSILLTINNVAPTYQLTLVRVLVDCLLHIW